MNKVQSPAEQGPYADEGKVELFNLCYCSVVHGA